MRRQFSHGSAVLYSKLSFQAFDEAAQVTVLAQSLNLPSSQKKICRLPQQQVVENLELLKLLLESVKIQLRITAVGHDPIPFRDYENTALELLEAIKIENLPV